MMQVKRDPLVLLLAALVLGGLGFLVYKRVITWDLALGGVVLFGLPSVFGAAKDRSGKTDPPPPLPVLLLVVGALALPELTACTTPPAAKTPLELAGYKAALDECRVKGKAAKSYEVYEACAEEADRRFGKEGAK